MSENEMNEPAKDNTSEVKATELEQKSWIKYTPQETDNYSRDSIFNLNSLTADIVDEINRLRESVAKLEKIIRDYPFTQETLLRQKVAELELELREYKRFPRTLIGCNVRDCSFSGEAGCTREQIVLLEDGSCQDSEFVCDECKHTFYSALNRVRNLKGEDKSVCDSCNNEDDFYLREEPFFQDY